MGRKGKRRKRPQRHRAPERAAEQVAAQPAEEAPEPVTPEVVDRDRPSPDRPRGLFGAGMIPSPYPPLTRSLGPAARAVGSDPVVLILSFLFVLAAWGTFAGLGRAPTPPQMALFMALPPVAIFADAILSLSAIPDSFGSLGVVVGVTVVRSLVLAVVLTRLLARLGGDAPGGARPVLLRSLSVFAVNAAGLGLVLAGFLLLSGFLGQLLAFVLVAGIGLYFLGMAIVVVVAEGVSAAEAFRRSFRAARLPGMRHVSLVMLYLVFTVWVASLTPTGALPSATPSLTVWVLALVETFVHLVVLGAFAHRWLSVRDEVPSGPARRRERTGARR